MMSLRMLGRVAPKSAFRSCSGRSLSSLSRHTSLRPSWQSLKKPSYPAFSTSIVRREPAGESDQVLSEKLNQERSLELESRDTSQLPDHIREFLDSSSWKIEDTPGNHNVILTKQFGNENIKVEFTINDLMDVSEEADEMDEDAALADEDFDEPRKQTINQSGTQGGKVDVVAEDSISPADRGEIVDETPAMTPEYNMRFQVTITKPGDKAVFIVAETQDGALTIEHISNGLPTEKAMDSGYAGPPMTSLDPDLQAMLEQYLEERGIDANMATFAFAYNDYKEQREYVDWLQKLKDFVDT